MIAVKGAQGAGRLVEGGGPQLAIVLQMNQEIEHPRLGKLGLRLTGIVIGQLIDPAEGSLLGARTKAFEVDKAPEVIIP